MGIQVDFGEELGRIEFPDDWSEEQVKIDARQNWDKYRSSLIEANQQRNERETAEQIKRGDIPVTVGERIGSIAASLVQGAAEGVASVPEFISNAAERLNRKLPLGEDVPAKEMATGKLATSIRERANQWAEQIPGIEEEFWSGDVPRGLGQIGSMLTAGGAGSLLGKAAAKAAVTTAAFTAEAQDAFNRELSRQTQTGETEDKDQAMRRALVYATGATAIENWIGAGRMLRKYQKLFGKTTEEAAANMVREGIPMGPIRSFLGKTIKETGVGAVEEGLQRALQDLIIDRKLDPDAILREAAVGGVVQGIATAPANALESRGQAPPPPGTSSQQAPPPPAGTATSQTDEALAAEFDEVSKTVPRPAAAPAPEPGALIRPDLQAQVAEPPAPTPSTALEVAPPVANVPEPDAVAAPAEEAAPVKTGNIVVAGELKPAPAEDATLETYIGGEFRHESGFIGTLKKDEAGRFVLESGNQVFELPVSPEGTIGKAGIRPLYLDTAKQPTGQFPERQATVSRLQASRNAAAFRRAKAQAQATKPKPLPAPTPEVREPVPTLPDAHSNLLGAVERVIGMGPKADMGMKYGALESTPVLRRILENHIRRLEALGFEKEAEPFYESLDRIEKFENTYLETVTKPGKPSRTPPTPPALAAAAQQAEAAGAPLTAQAVVSTAAPAPEPASRKPVVDIPPPAPVEGGMSTTQKPEFRDVSEDFPDPNKVPMWTGRRTITEDLVQSAKTTAMAWDAPAYIGSRKAPQGTVPEPPSVFREKPTFVWATISPDGKVELEPTVYRPNPNAIPIQSTTPGLPRQEGSQVGLREMVPGNQQPETPSGQAAETKAPELMTPEEFDAAVRALTKKRSAEMSPADLEPSKKLIAVLSNVQQPGPEMGGIGPTERTREMLVAAGYVERAKAKKGRLTEKGRFELDQLKLGIRKFEAESDYLKDEIQSELPVSAAAVDAYGLTLPAGYVREGDRYVFKGGEQPNAQKERPQEGVQVAPAPTAPAPATTGAGEVGEIRFGVSGERVRDITTPDGTFEVDASIAGLVQKINALGLRTAQSMSGVKADYEGTGAESRYAPDGYIAWYEKDLTAEQIEAVRLAAKDARIFFDDKGLLFFRPNIEVRVGMLQNGKHPQELKPKANELANEKMLREGRITKKDLKTSSGSVTTRATSTYPSADEFFYEWLDLRNAIFKDLQKEGGGVISDQEIKSRWTAFEKALIERLREVPGVQTPKPTEPVLVREDAPITQPTPSSGSTLRAAAKKVRSRKSKPNDTAQMVFFPGLSAAEARAIYNTVLDVVAAALEAGASIAEAIERAVADLRYRGVKNVDETKLRAHLRTLYEEPEKPPAPTPAARSGEVKETQGRRAAPPESGITGAGLYPRYSEENARKEADAFISGRSNEEAFRAVMDPVEPVDPLLKPYIFTAIVDRIKTEYDALGDPAEGTGDAVRKAQLKDLMFTIEDAGQKAGSISGQNLQAQQGAVRGKEGLINWLRTMNVWRDKRNEKLEKEGVPTGAAEPAKKKARKTALEKLATDDGLEVFIRKFLKGENVNLRELFRDLPEAQKDRIAEIIRRMLADPVFSKLSDADRKAIGVRIESTFRRLQKEELEKALRAALEGKSKKAKDAVEDAMPELVRQMNLGMLTNEKFRALVAEKLGIPQLSEATARKLEKLGEKAQKTPEGFRRNRVLIEMIESLAEAGLPWTSVVKDLWFADVLSSPRTWVDVATGGLGQLMSVLGRASFDAAILRGEWKAATTMWTRALSQTLRGFVNAADVVATGDYSRIPGYDKKLKAILAGELGPDSLEILRKQPQPWKKALGQMSTVRRIMAGLDYIGALGVRDVGLIYTSMSRNDRAELAALLKKLERSEVQAALAQAEKELGPGAKRVDVWARQQEIIEQGISEQTKAGAEQLSAQVALTAEPRGISGEVYRFVKRLPFAVRSVAGLNFVRSALNMVNNASDWMPMVGIANYARSSEWMQSLPENHFLKRFALDTPPEQRRLTAIAQIATLPLVLAAYNLFDGDDDDFDIEGSWFGLTPDQIRQNQSAGKTPLSIKVGNRYVSFKNTPFAGALALVGNMRDQAKYNSKEWDNKSWPEKAINGWFMGMAYVRDLAAVSQLAQLTGSMYNKQVPDVESFLKRAGSSVGSTLSGFIPLVSLQRDLDSITDPNVYKANGGFEAWVRNIPYARRTVGQGPALNLLGDEVKAPRYPWGRWMTQGPDDPVFEVLGRKAAQGVFVPMPQKIDVFDSRTRQKREQTDAEYYRYTKDVLQGYGKWFRNRENLRRFDRAKPADAAEMLDRELSRIREAARARARQRAISSPSSAR